jgi:hypothetical protein
MMQTTTDTAIIKGWVVRNNGKPQQINDPEATGDAVGIRIAFPEIQDDEFMPENEVQLISWHEFFRRFREMKLQFVFDPDSRYYRFEPVGFTENESDTQHEEMAQRLVEELKKR